MSKKKKLKVISLFAGCGGMDLGFFLAENKDYEYELVWANDFEKAACETYRKNFKHHIEEGDIWDVNINNIPDADVVIGGFPCQDFSILRGEKREGLDSKRGTLYTRFVETVSKKKPLFFVAENVKGILTIHGGLGIKKIQQDFANVNGFGYDVDYKLINFAKYGVPQNRERVIIVGIRNDLGKRFVFPKFTHEKNPVSSKQALDGVEEIKLNNEKLKSHPKTKEKLECIPPGGNYKYIPGYENNNWMSLIYKRLHPDKPSPTIVANGGGGTWGYHFSEPRALTNRERARLQTFPDDFEFCGTTTEVRRQLGNAVPPMGIKHIAEQLLKMVNNELGLQVCMNGEKSGHLQLTILDVA